MQSLLLVVSAAAVVLEAALECKPKPHPVPIGDCCKIDYGELSSPTAVEKCRIKIHEKYSGKPSLDEKENATACYCECVYDEMGLLTSDRKLDNVAMKAHWSTSSPDHVRQLLQDKDAKCFQSYVSAVEPGLECQSGAMEYSRCLQREVFLDCPVSMWSGTQECEVFKAEVASCPQAYVTMAQ